MTQMRTLAFGILVVWGLISCDVSPGSPDNQTLKQVTFNETPYPVKNPLKGIMVHHRDGSRLKNVTMFKAPIGWSEIEQNAGDGVSRIISFSNDSLFNHRWDAREQRSYSVEKKNIKVNPDVSLDFNGDVGDFFPSDLTILDHDNQTDKFIDRVDSLVKKMAEAWDNDPRVGFVYMGLVGRYGEAFYKLGGDGTEPMVLTPKLVKALGDSFSRYFKHKKVMVRNLKYFNEDYLRSHGNEYRGNTYSDYYQFGLYWDSFAHEAEMNDGLLDTVAVIRSSKIWRTQPILGEVAPDRKYNALYENIHDTLTHDSSVDYIRDYIFAVHATGLSGISNYDDANAAEVAAIGKLHESMGYRFILKQASYSDVVTPGGELVVAFDVQNVGAAPFYYDWPVRVALLDKDTREVVYRHKFENVDIRKWMPGDDWDFDGNYYKQSPKTYHVDGRFVLPDDLAQKEYILTLEIDDPAGGNPSVRFAVDNYYKGGRTPIGLIGIGEAPGGSLPPFDDIEEDDTLYYEVVQANGPSVIKHIDAGQSGNMLSLEMSGDFSDKGHYDFYLDTDGDANSGYSSDHVKGADYLVEDGKVYQYPAGGVGWTWNLVGAVNRESKTAESLQVEVPLESLNITDSIRYTGAVSTDDWSDITFYSGVMPGNLVIDPKSHDAHAAHAFIPEEDVTRDDVYQNGNVIRVNTVAELNAAVESARPYTTIILEAGRYEGVHVQFPEGIHHLTIKGQGKDTIIVPRGFGDGNSAMDLQNSSSPELQTHDINFVDLNIEGEKGDEKHRKEFIYVSGGRFIEDYEKGVQGDGRPYGPYNVYIYNVTFKNLALGIYSHLYAHDWTVDHCTFVHSTYSHFWYMMGWHLAVINSDLIDPTHDALAIRGYYPEGEVHTSISSDLTPHTEACYGNVYVRDRGSRSTENGFLPPDDWTHMIANNRFRGASSDRGERSLAFVAVAYGIYDEDQPCDAEQTYLPPQNIRIVDNKFDAQGNERITTHAIQIDAWQGLNNDNLGSINGIIITGNQFIRRNGSEEFIYFGDSGNQATREELDRSDISNNEIN